MDFIIVITLLVVGLGAGRVAERRHISGLNAREATNVDVLITDIRTFPGGSDAGTPPTLIVAETVISSDYFKSFLATLKRIIGGELRTFESLMMRARREVVAQLAEHARSAGYDAVCNVRIEGVDITGGTTKQRGVIVVAIQASGTAYRRTRAA